MNINAIAKALDTTFSAAQDAFLAAMDAEFKAQKITDLRWQAYMLATNWHECRFKPIREGDWKGEGITDKQAYDRVTAYCKKHGKKNYAARHPVTKQSYYGRGGPQLTHYNNYLKLGEAIGLPLTTEPDLVLRPDVTAKVTVLGMTKGLFTGRKLSQYFDDKVSDPKGARRIVNGTDKAGLIADYYTDIAAVLRKEPVRTPKQDTGAIAAGGAAAGGAAVAAQAAGLNWGLVIAIGAGVVVAAVAIYFLNKRRRSL